MGPHPRHCIRTTNPLGIQLDNLTADDTFIYWADSGQIKRLLGTATPLPVVNMWIEGWNTGADMEVTQGIQSAPTQPRHVDQEPADLRAGVRQGRRFRRIGRDGPPV